MTSISLENGFDELEAQASPPKPKMTWKGVGLAAACWILYSLLYTSFVAQQEPTVPFVVLLLGQLIYAVLLGLYSIPIWWLAVREMSEMHWAWPVALHLLLGPLYAWGGLESYLSLVRFLGGPEATTEMEANYQWILFGGVTIYAVQFAMYHLVSSVKRLRWREQQATELLARAREQELAALKAQVNPHFLFNTLNSISATLKRDPDQAREMIAKLAGLLRYALDSSSQDLVPLRDEIEFTRRYLRLERHRFSDRLDVSVEIDTSDEALETPVPPMVLQPLVENALRHGIAPSESGGTVTVRVASRNGRTRVEVADTGVGVDGEAESVATNHGRGLVNTSARLEHTYGSESQLHTRSNDPTGFIVWFTIPRDGVSGKKD